MHKLSSILFIIICVTLLTRVEAFNKLDTLKKVLVVSKDTIQITLVRSQFDKKQHKIGFSKTEFIKSAQDSFPIPDMIDNHNIYGTDGELPHYEISVFEVLWNGYKIKIPKTFYADCYEPNFEEEERLIRFVPSIDGKNILIEMNGSDAAGSYTVWWIVSKNGKHQRFISDHEC